MARKRRAEEDKLIAKVANCRSLPECEWQVKHYKAMCSYKKDPALGKNLSCVFSGNKGKSGHLLPLKERPFCPPQ
jgi:hypothetical protein